MEENSKKDIIKLISQIKTHNDELENLYNIFLESYSIRDNLIELSKKIPNKNAIHKKFEELLSIDHLISQKFSENLTYNSNLLTLLYHYIKPNTVIKRNNEFTYISNYFKNNFKNEINNRIQETITFILNISDLFQNLILNENKKENIDFLESQIKSTSELLVQKKQDILNSLDDLLSRTCESISSLDISVPKNFKNSDAEYISRIKEETNLLLKQYKNEIFNLNEKYENEFNNFKLDQEKIIKSSELIKINVEAGFNNLKLLNERIQNIELEFSKIIGVESTKVKKDLDNSREALIGVVDSITIEATTKLNEINTAHSDFKNLVEKAGIYELTQNYKTKANEEKKDYKLNMWLTIGAIALAIIATIAVITIPIIEHWKASPPVAMDYFTLFARLSISIMFFVLALYTSKQAAKHYECYQENHRTFLQLAALEPFMTRMSHDEQKEIRKGLIPSYFNQGLDGKFAAKGDEVDMAMMFTFMDKLSNFSQNKKDPKVVDNPANETKPQV